MANLRAKQGEAVNRVENGVQSGPALQRVRAALPAIQAAAHRFKQRTFAVTGGVRIDPMTRVERRVGGNPNLSPEGQAAELTAARDEFQATVNGALQGANDDLNTVATIHEVVPPLGTQLLIPPNRAAELAAIGELLREGKFEQWANVAQRALTTDDRALAEVVSYTGRSVADTWHKDRAALDATRTALDEHFSTPSTLAGTYAATLVRAMQEALQSIADTLERPDGADQVLAANPANPRLWWAVRPLPPGDLDLAQHWANVELAARAPASASGVMVLDASIPGQPRLVPGRSSEAPGPVHSAADSGPSQI